MSDHDHVDDHDHDVDDHGTTWLTKARDAAGFRTDMELAVAAGILKPSGQSPVSNWRAGTRPRWDFVQRLAATLGVAIDEVVDHMWLERPGDPCSCGCTGVKVLPRPEEPAYVLRVMRVCGCGRQTTFDPDKARRDHTDKCADCSKRRKRSERWTFHCAGYIDHSRRRTARTCLRSRTFTEPYVRRVLSTGSPAAGRRWGKGKFHLPDPRPPFVLKPGTDVRSFGPEDVEWSCARCLLGERGITVLEARLKAAGATERIYSGKQRSEMMVDTLASPATMQDRAQRASADKRRTEGLSESGKVNRAKGWIVAWWSRTPLPNVIVFQCAGCGKLNFIRASLARRSAYAALWHQRCLWAWQGSEEGRTYARQRAKGEPASMPGRIENPRRGRPVVQDRRRDFAWAIQHYLGDRSLREIGSEFGLHHATIKKGTDGIVRDLPDPDLVSSEFRRHVELLIAGIMIAGIK